MKTDTENNWTRAYAKYNFDVILPKIAKMCGFDFAIQCELCGPGIQGNIYNLSEQELFIYNIRNLSTHKDLNPLERAKFYTEYLADVINHVPVYQNEREGILQCCHNICTPLGEPLTQEYILTSADGTSALANVRREGVVFKAYNGFSFKVISNEYLEHGHKIN